MTTGSYVGTTRTTQHEEMDAHENGCSPALALRLFNGMASVGILYSLPLSSLTPTNWVQLDVVRRTAIQQHFSLPPFSHIGHTLAEAGNMPLSLHADKGALNHIDRVHRLRHERKLVFRLHNLQRSR